VVLTSTSYSIEQAPNQQIQLMARSDFSFDLPGVFFLEFGLETAESNAPAITDLDLVTGTPFDNGTPSVTTIGTDAPHRRRRSVFAGNPFTIAAGSTIRTATVTFDASSTPLATYRFTLFGSYQDNEGSVYGSWRVTEGQEISVQVIPEPGASVLLTVLGCGVLVLVRRACKARAA